MTVLNLGAGLKTVPEERSGWPVADLDEVQVDLDLEVGALWRARGDQRGRVIICYRGVVWITQEKDLVDYVLQEGEIFIVTLPGSVLVQALEPASVTAVARSTRARPYAGDHHVFQ